jgi:TetR/AcrR family transcriptional repressor of nem operon
MNRPREYDLEIVLEKATDLFWEKGYGGTSIIDLVARTGLNSRSMYNEFGDKEGLFLACIDHYVSESLSGLGKILAKKPLGLSNIEAFFDYQVDNVTPDYFKGCLLVNSLSEKEVLSEKINSKVKLRISNIIDLMYRCLKAEQDKGGISKEVDCMALANYFLCFDFGLMNFGRNQSKKKEIRKIVDFALTTLAPLRTNDCCESNI